MGEDESHLEVRVHLPAGSLRRLRLAHCRRRLQLQPRRDRRLPAQRHARHDRRDGQRLRDLPARRGRSSDITTNRYVSDRWRYYSGYAQDDWRVSNKLTVNYGLRYEYTPPTFEGYYPDGYSNFNPDLPNPAADGRLGASEFAGEGAGRTGKNTMYDAWPWGLSPRVGAVYSVNDDTVVRLSAARTFGSVKNTGGSSHWNGFIGGYNVTAPALRPAPRSTGIRGGRPGPSRRSSCRTRSTAATFPTGSRTTRAAFPSTTRGRSTCSASCPGRFVVEAGYNAQLGRHLTTNLLSLNQVDPAIFQGFVQQYGGAGAIKLMNSRMDSTLARQANIPYPYASFPGSQSVRQALRPYPQYLDINTGADGGDRSGRSSYHAFVLKGEKRYEVGPDVPQLVRVLEDVLAALGSRQRRRRAGDEPLQPRRREGPVGLRPDARRSS